jgi:hypothetical protein
MKGLQMANPSRPPDPHRPNDPVRPDDPRTAGDASRTRAGAGTQNSYTRWIVIAAGVVLVLLLLGWMFGGTTDETGVAGDDPAVTQEADPAAPIDEGVPMDETAPGDPAQTGAPGETGTAPTGETQPPPEPALDEPDAPADPQEPATTAPAN